MKLLLVLSSAIAMVMFVYMAVVIVRQLLVMM